MVTFLEKDLQFLVDDDVTRDVLQEGRHFTQLLQFPVRHQFLLIFVCLRILLPVLFFLFLRLFLLLLSSGGLLGNLVIKGSHIGLKFIKFGILGLLAQRRRHSFFSEQLLQSLVLFFQLPNEFVGLALVHHRLVLDLLGLIRIPQSRKSFLIIIARR